MEARGNGVAEAVPVASPAGEGGYGSKLLNRAMTVKLGGSISCDWSAEGVIVTLRMTKGRLAR
jgi:two-component sensor histidine kinase